MTDAPDSATTPRATGSSVPNVGLFRFLLGRAGWRMWVSVAAGMAGGWGLAGVMRVTHRALTTTGGDNLPHLLPFAGWFAAFLGGSLIAEKVFIGLSEALKVEFRDKLAHQLLHTEYAELERRGTERVWTLLVGDVEGIADYICWLPRVIVHLSMLLGCYVYMAWLSLPAFAFSAAFAAAALWLYARINARVSRVELTSLHYHEGVLAVLRYLTHGLKSLLLSRGKREDFLGQHLRRATATARDINTRSRFLQSLASRLAVALVLVGLAGVVFGLPHVVELSAATLVGLVQATLFSLPPFEGTLGLLPRTVAAAQALDRMRELGLDLAGPAPLAGLRRSAPPAMARDFRELVLADVVFRYAAPAGDERGFGIGPVSLRLAAGEVVFLVGGNGSGKTTLAKVLCGLYAPAAGSLSVNGRPVAATGRDDYRQLFAAVFSDDALFNHAIGAPPDSAPRMRELLRLIQLDHKVSVYEGSRFSTIDLSQGQKRRLLLLVALLEDKPVFLFDEWAADQDPYFRKLFYEEFLPDLRARGRAVLVISHDDRYYRCADRILKIEAGLLVAYDAAGAAIGTPDHTGRG
jgi:putative ATP-binding cassette transporter